MDENQSNQVSIVPDPDTELQLWYQLGDEPDEAYQLFMIYLALGIRRSIRAAFITWLAKTRPEVLVRNESIAPPKEWKDYASQYDWRLRAISYDRITGIEAFKAVEEAAIRIRAATPDAVDTLIRELNSPRNSVAAAKEILDRAGVKTAAVQYNHKISAEDLAKAEQELKEWTTDAKTSSG